MLKTKSWEFKGESTSVSEWMKITALICNERKAEDGWTIATAKELLPVRIWEADLSIVKICQYGSPVLVDTVEDVKGPSGTFNE